jgi:hypothetical protein
MAILVTKFLMSLKLNCCPLGFGAGYFIQPKTALLKEKFFFTKFGAAEDGLDSLR